MCYPFLFFFCVETSWQTEQWTSPQNMVWIFPKIGLSTSFLNQQTLKGSTLWAVSHFCNISEYFSCPTLWKGSSAAKYHRKQTSKLLFVNKDLKEKGRLSWAWEPFDQNHYDKQVKGFWPANDLQSLLLVVAALGYFFVNLCINLHPGKKTRRRELDRSILFRF